MPSSRVTPQSTITGILYDDDDGDDNDDDDDDDCGSNDFDCWFWPQECHLFDDDYDDVGDDEYYDDDDDVDVILIVSVPGKSHFCTARPASRFFIVLNFITVPIIGLCHVDLSFQFG